MGPDSRLTFMSQCVFMLFFLTVSFENGFCDDGYLTYHDLIASPATSVAVDGLVRLDLKLPSSIAVSPDGRQVYVADAYAPPSISVIDVNEMRQTDVVHFSGHGAISAIATSGNGTDIYAALSKGEQGELVEISVADHGVTRTLSLDYAPLDLAVDEVANLIFVLTKKKVYHISLDGFEIVEDLNAGRDPVKIRQSEKNRQFFVTNAGSRSVTVITAEANSTRIRDVAVPSVPWDVMALYQDNSDTTASSNVTSDNVTSESFLHGRLFVAPFHSDHLVVYSLPDLRQNALIFTGSAPTMLESTSAHDILFVLRTCPSALLSVDPDNLRVIKSFNLPVASPRDMAMTADDSHILISADNGNLYFVPVDQFRNRQPEPEPVYHFTVYFDLDKAVIKPGFKSMLDRLAERLKSTMEKVELDGYTCDLGPETHNDKLSLRRAEAVRAYLEAMGVPEERIRIKGFGEANPSVPNINTDNRRLNRRVEIEVKDGT